MSFRSDRLEILGCHSTETTNAGDVDLDPIGASTPRRSPRGETDDARPVSGARIRVVSLRAEVELLKAERETLANQVLALDADVARLEDEVTTLERTLEHEQQRRQRVIDRYEQILAERNDVNQAPSGESEAATNGADARRTRPLSGCRSSIETVWTRVKHILSIG